MDSRAFAKLGLQVVSLDFNPTSCSVTLVASKLAGHQIDVVRGDAEFLPFRGSCVDLAYSYGVLHHTPDTQHAILEIHRIVRKCAFVMLYNRNFTYYAQRLRHPWMSRQAVFNMYDKTVLSKLYTKGQVKRMFTVFRTVRVARRMFWGARDSRAMHLLLLVLHWTGLERVYGSFNLIWAEKE